MSTMTTEQVRNLYRCAYAWRAEDDLEAGDTDLSRHRELQATEFDRWLTSVKAEAWDEGYWLGINRHTGPGNPYKENQ